MFLVYGQLTVVSLLIILIVDGYLVLAKIVGEIVLIATVLALAMRSILWQLILLVLLLRVGIHQQLLFVLAVLALICSHLQSSKQA